MKSLLQAVGSLPFLALAAVAGGLSAAPGVFVFLQIQEKAQGLSEPFYYLAIGGALVAGYITYGTALIFLETGFAGHFAVVYPRHLHDVAETDVSAVYLHHSLHQPLLPVDGHEDGRQRGHQHHRHRRP